MKIWREGDRSKGICERCRRLVETRFERRTFPLTRPPVDVPDVLVASCIHCGAIVAVPPQSSPRINAARAAAGATFEARITKELDDVLAWMTSRFSTVPNRPLRDALLRHYLGELARSPEFARRVEHFARGTEVRGQPAKRLRLQIPASLLDQASAKADAAGISNRSKLMRALIPAMAEDIEKPGRKRHVMLKVFPGIGTIMTPSKQ